MSSVPAVPAQKRAGDFRIGRVFERALAVYQRNFLQFSLLSLVAAVASIALRRIPEPDADAFFSAANLLYVLVVFVVIAIGSFIAAALAFAGLQDLRGRQVSVRASLRAAGDRITPLVALSILGGILLIAILFGILFFGVGVFAGATEEIQGLALVVGLLLLLGIIVVSVTSITVFVRCCVVIPICVIERADTWRSLKRSLQLTKGDFWKLFGAIMVLYGGFFIVGQLITVATAPLGFFVEPAATLIWDALNGAYLDVFALVLYYDLRLSREGDNFDEIATVFD